MADYQVVYSGTLERTEQCPSLSHDGIPSQLGPGQVFVEATRETIHTDGGGSLDVPFGAFSLAPRKERWHR